MSRPRAAQTPAASGTHREPVATCPLYHESVELIGSRWTGAILWVLMSGPMRFTAIVDAVPGMSDRLCCSRLRELEDAGLVDRRVLSGRRAGVEYRLTRAGRDLEHALTAIGQWGHRWLNPHPADRDAYHLPHVPQAEIRSTRRLSR